MSKSQLNSFLGVKSFDSLNTDSVIGGTADGKKKKKGGEKEKEVKAEIKVAL